LFALTAYIISVYRGVQKQYQDDPQYRSSVVTFTWKSPWHSSKKTFLISSGMILVTCITLSRVQGKYQGKASKPSFSGINTSVLCYLLPRMPQELVTITCKKCKRMTMTFYHLHATSKMDGGYVFCFAFNLLTY